MNDKALRFYEIDGLRFIAAFMVVLYHYTFRGEAADNMSPVAFDLLGVVTLCYDWNARLRSYELLAERFLR